MIRKTKRVTVDLKTIEEWRPLSIYAALQGKSLRGLVREMLAPGIQEICKQIQIPDPPQVKTSDNR
ncbi:hypothetical protein Pan153_53290 [Gimesia panareensis]|uniref:Uncharacterized protein n=1 Tax=Gimesia panareensis TaxID=2527978 RepID=A0A518FWA2_9PLAN|nr:hypothetical protein [Gimesia panareensis]QDV20653.1 hypothetical protein Pan153_53290 [Gimesia panareensis]